MGLKRESISVGVESRDLWEWAMGAGGRTQSLQGTSCLSTLPCRGLLVPASDWCLQFSIELPLRDTHLLQ